MKSRGLPEDAQSAELLPSYPDLKKIAWVGMLPPSPRYQATIEYRPGLLLSVGKVRACGYYWDGRNT